MKKTQGKTTQKDNYSIKLYNDIKSIYALQILCKGM